MNQIPLWLDTVLHSMHGDVNEASSPDPFSIESSFQVFVNAMVKLPYCDL